jgi:hypothetical protein
VHPWKVSNQGFILDSSVWAVFLPEQRVYWVTVTLCGAVSTNRVAVSLFEGKVREKNLGRVFCLRFHWFLITDFLISDIRVWTTLLAFLGPGLVAWKEEAPALLSCLYHLPWKQKRYELYRLCHKRNSKVVKYTLARKKSHGRSS